jgi:hypothetical protein
MKIVEVGGKIAMARMAEVVTALEKLRPLGSLIRDACWEPISGNLSSARRGDSL